MPREFPDGRLREFPAPKTRAAGAPFRSGGRVRPQAMRRAKAADATPLAPAVRPWTPGGDLHRREELTTGQQETFGYDPLHRLNGQNEGATPIATYDALGNITNRAGVGEYAYDSDTGRLDWYGNSLNVVPHDLNGNVERIQDTELKWNAFDKIRTLSTGGEQSSFLYDAGGTRALRYDEEGYTMTSGGLFELSNQPGAKPKTRETKARFFVPVGGAVVEVRDQLLSGGEKPGKWDREVFYQYNDHLGSGSLLVSEDGSVEEAVSYGPWGEARAWEDWTLEATPEELQNMASGFTGHQPELDSGLINMRGRMYSPMLARFLSVDPVIESAGDAQTWNAYSYVQNNPLRYVDPSGRCAEATDWSEPVVHPNGSSTRWKRDGSDCDRGDVPQEVPAQDTGPTGGSTGTGDAGGGGGRSGGGSSTNPNGDGQGGPEAGGGCSFADRACFDAFLADAEAERLRKRAHERAQQPRTGPAPGEPMWTPDGNVGTTVVSRSKGGQGMMLVAGALGAAGPAGGLIAGTGSANMAVIAAAETAKAYYYWALGAGVSAMNSCTAGLRCGGSKVPPPPPPASIPNLTRGPAGAMVGQAVAHLKEIPGAANKAAAFRAMVPQIARANGDWSAILSRGADGSYIFAGGAGEALVISPNGAIFRGSILNWVAQGSPVGAAQFVIVGTGDVLSPVYDALRRL